MENLTIDWKTLLGNLWAFLTTGVGSVVTSTISVTMRIFGAVNTAFIALIFAVYLLLQKERLGLQCRKALYALVPRKAADQTVKVCSLSHRIFSSYIAGQCMEAVILGCMFFVSMSLLKIPYALLTGCLIAVTALIPIVGAFIGCFVGAFLLLMVSPMQAVFFVALFLVLQQVEGNFIYPHVVGNSVGLPSIWVLAAVTIGGGVLGIGGMLLAVYSADLRGLRPVPGVCIYAAEGKRDQGKVTRTPERNRAGKSTEFYKAQCIMYNGQAEAEKRRPGGRCCIIGNQLFPGRSTYRCCLWINFLLACAKQELLLDAYS